VNVRASADVRGRQGRRQGGRRGRRRGGGPAVEPHLRGYVYKCPSQKNPTRVPYSHPRHFFDILVNNYRSGSHNCVNKGTHI
jgi:hypothetical protein